MVCLRFRIGLLLFFLSSTIPYSHLSSATTNFTSFNRQLIWELISTMNIRQQGAILDNTTVYSFTDHVYSKYTRNSFYRKFVHVFDIYLKPKLILNNGDACDPSRNNYRYPENNLVTEESLAYWVAMHVPGSSVVATSGNYCDFRQGLVCNSHKKVCECPKGATYTPRGKTGVCFIDPYTECQLPDLGNSAHVKGLLLETLPDLIFNPERPLSCSPGTHCRFYSPYLDFARCWCHDLTMGKCSTAKVYWSLASTQNSSDGEPVDISQVLQLMWRSTFGFEVKHKTDTSPPNTTINAPSIRTKEPVLHGLTELMESLGEEGFINPSIVNHLTVLKSTLNESVNLHCWSDMNPNYVCTPGRKIVKNSSDWTTLDYCDCQQQTMSNTTMTTIDSQQWLLFGVECTLNEVIDSRGMCEPGTACYRWDLNAPTGICYCPEGYGWQPCEKRSEQDKFSLTNFIHPITVSARGEELQLVQFLLVNLERSQIYVGDASANKSCDISINSKWKILYDYLLSLERYPVIIKNGPDYPTLLSKLNTIPPGRETICDFKNGWECIPPGECVQSGTKMAETSHGKQVITTWTNAQRYADDLEKLFDSVEVPKQNVDCNGEICPEQTICLEVFPSRTRHPVQTQECNRNKTESICQCLNTLGVSDHKGIIDFNKIAQPCGAKQVSFGLCERYGLQSQIDTLTYSIIQESVMDVGEKCDFWSELNILTAIRLLKLPPEEQPLHQILGNLFKALESTKMFCDRRKLLRCSGTLGTCQCWQGTSVKWNDNGGGVIPSKFCYATQGSCNKDPVLLSHAFPQEWSNIRGHYGDLSNPSHLDRNDCLKNLCVKSTPGGCLDDAKYGNKWISDHVYNMASIFRVNLMQLLGIIFVVKYAFL